MIIWNRGTRTLNLGEVGERECPECGTVRPVPSLPTYVRHGARKELE